MDLIYRVEVGSLRVALLEIPLVDGITKCSRRLQTAKDSTSSNNLIPLIGWVLISHSIVSSTSVVDIPLNLFWILPHLIFT